jgi:hypothetical protein
MQAGFCHFLYSSIAISYILMEKRGGEIRRHLKSISVVSVL